MMKKEKDNRLVITYRSLDELVMYARNPRVNDPVRLERRVYGDTEIGKHIRCKNDRIAGEMKREGTED